MDAAIFLRGVNTGNRALKTAEFAAHFPDFQLRNIGAAGTFVARAAPPATKLAEAIQARLPFTTEIMVVDATTIHTLVSSRPFRGQLPTSGVRWAVSIVSPEIRGRPALPILRPDSTRWEVRILRARGPFALSETRRLSEKRVLYPNEVVEREFRVRATTRWWETVEQVHRLLESTDRS